MTRNRIDLSICIVTWNTREELRDCLSSIFSHPEGLRIQVVVIDNASSDNTAEMVRGDFPEVEVIANQTNLGFARANNVALRQCQGEYVLLLNPDVVIIEPCFKRMIDFLNTHPDAGVVGCRLVNPDGGIQKSFFESFPTPKSEFIWGMMLDKLSSGGGASGNDSRHEVEVAWLVGGCMLFRRDLLMRLNGFSEEYFMYGEDLDLCYRVRELGLRAYYSKDIRLLHHHGASSKKQAKRHFSAIMQRESVNRFMVIHYGRLNALLYRSVWIVSASLRVTISVLGCLASLVGFTRDAERFFEVLNKYVRVVLWGVGLEKLTRDVT